MSVTHYVRKIIVLTAIVGCSMRSAAASDYREWSDTSGKFRIDAEFVDSTKDSCRLKTKDGKIVTVPLEKLSTKDKEYVQNRVRAKSPSSSSATDTKVSQKASNGPVSFDGPIWRGSIDSAKKQQLVIPTKNLTDKWVAPQA
jgi:hypothetical protein